MRTHTTSTGQVLDLSGLTRTELAYYERCHNAYLDGMTWEEFSQFAYSPENPVMEHGRITPRGVDHPLFRAILDMEVRLGARRGYFKVNEGDDIWGDPAEDEALNISQAAARKGVTRQTIYNAIDAGELVADRSSTPAVSRNSLSVWRPDEARQRAGKTRRMRLVVNGKHLGLVRRRTRSIAGRPFAFVSTETGDYGFPFELPEPVDGFVTVEVEGDVEDYRQRDPASVQ